MSQRSCKLLRTTTIGGRRCLAGSTVTLDETMARVLVNQGVVEAVGMVPAPSNRGDGRGGRRAEKRG